MLCESAVSNVLLRNISLTYSIWILYIEDGNNFRGFKASIFVTFLSYSARFHELIQIIREWTDTERGEVYR